MSKNLRVFKVFCFVLAGLMALIGFGALSASFASAEKVYDGGTFEDFYAQVMRLYEDYGDVNEGGSVAISKNEVLEDNGELYLSASTLSALSNGKANGVQVLSADIENYGGADDEQTLEVDTKNEELLGSQTSALSYNSESAEEVAGYMPLSDTEYLVEEIGEKYIISEPSYTNRIVVRYEGDLPAYKTEAYAEGLGWHIYQYTSKEATDEAYEYYNSLDYVDFVEYDLVVMGASATENDEVSSSATTSYLSWGASYTGIDEYLSYLSYIYDESELERVYVPILDSGINTDHSLFQGRYSSVYGRNFTSTTADGTVVPDENFEDDNNHGSHTSGIIADQTLDNVILIPLKVLRANGKGSVTMIATAIEYVISIKESYNLNIRVMNMSLGLETEDGSPIYSRTLETVVKEAYNADIMSVVAAGNSHFNTSASAPANMYEEVIVVSALEENPYYEKGLCVADYSNYGSTVDLSAPGTAVESAYSNVLYGELSGTSMAAPHVTATIANILSNPSLSSLSNSEIENLLYKNAIDLGAEGKDIYYGYGCVNIANVGVETVGEVVFSEENSFQDAPINLTLSFSDAEYINGTYKIFYTLDETSPTLDDLEYTSPIEISTTTKITAVAFVFDDSGDIAVKSKVTSMTYYYDNQDLASSYTVTGSSMSGTLVSYNGELTTLVVPERINGLAITSVAENAFANSKVENLIFSSPNLLFNNYAFYSLGSLVSVDAEGAKYVGDYTFANCSNLTTVNLPSVFTVGDYAFKGCSKLTELSFPLITSVGTGALEDVNLTSLFLGGDLRNYGDSYFHADTIYAYSSSGYDTVLKNHTDELVLLDTRFVENYPTRVIYTESGEGTITFVYYVNENAYISEERPVFIQYRLAPESYFDQNYPSETVANDSPVNLGDGLFEVTFHFDNLTVGAVYSFQIYIYDAYTLGSSDLALTSETISVRVLSDDTASYNLNFDEGDYKIFVDGVSVASGYTLYADLDYSIQVVPATSYRVENVLVKEGANSTTATLDGDNTFTLSNVTGDVTLEVEMAEIEEFEISFIYGDGVVVLGSDSEFLSSSVIVPRNSSLTFSLWLNDAYEVTYVEIDGVRQTLKEEFVLENILSDHTVEIGSQPKSFVITVNTGVGGHAMQNLERVNYGEDKDIILDCEEGYYIKAVYVNGEEVEIFGNVLTLKNVTSDMSIVVEFEKEGSDGFEGAPLALLIIFAVALLITILCVVFLFTKKPNKNKEIM